MDETIKLDSHNYRIHGEENKRIITKSLEECGAGRSILVDRDNVVIAGNGVFEQAQKLGLNVRVVESDGKELIVVKRTDLSPCDEKRKLLALADNLTSDKSEFDLELIDEDFDREILCDWDLEIENFQITEELLDEFFDKESDLRKGKKKTVLCPHCGKNINEEINNEEENHNL